MISRYRCRSSTRPLTRVALYSQVGVPLPDKASYSGAHSPIELVVCARRLREIGEDLKDTYAVRDEFYSRLGTVDPDVISTKVNTAFTGGSVWPDLRQGRRVIRTAESLIFGSDGLADPYRDVEGDNAGFGVEVFAETTDESERDSSGPLKGSCLFHLVHDVSHSVAQDQYFKFRVARDGY